MSMAQIQLIGNLGRDPEMNYTPDGTAVCKFSIAVSKITGKGAEKSETTTWYNVTAWRNLGIPILLIIPENGRDIGYRRTTCPGVATARIGFPERSSPVSST